LSKVKVQELILHNWPAKILSVGCALVLFVFYQTSTLEERFFSVPLLIEGEGNMVPANDYPRMIRVTLRGNANSIYSIASSDIEAFIEIDGETEKGMRHFPVQVRKKETALSAGSGAAGAGAIEVSVDPIEVTVELDTKLSVFVSVLPKTRGEVAAGFELTKTTLNPSRIRVEGPEGLVRHYTELWTEAIDLEGRNADFTVVTRLANTDPLIIIQGESVIEFHGTVRSVMIIRSFTDVPVSAHNLDARLRLTEPPVSGELRLEGPQNVLETWIPGENVFVDCAGITEPGEYDLRLQVRLPANCRLLGTVAEASALTALNRAEAENEAGNGSAAADEVLPVIHLTVAAAQTEG
jgi:hypothetical protein